MGERLAREIARGRSSERATEVATEREREGW